MFEFATIDAGSGGPFEIAVDGRLTNDAGYAYTHRFDGSLRYVNVTLPASSTGQRITVYTTGSPFGGLRLPQGETLDAQSADALNFASVAFEGDSISEGSAATTQTKTWIMQAAMLLGIRNPINLAIGGTGYLAYRPNDPTIPQRISNVATAANGAAPDAVVIAAGINDCSVAPPSPYPLNDVQAAALAYFTALRAAAPNMVIIVLGPFTDFNSAIYSATSMACRDALFAAARQVPLTYTVDVSNWVTPANAGTVFDGNNNGPHPVDAGHAIYSMRAAAAIGAIFAGL